MKALTTVVATTLSCVLAAPALAAAPYSFPLRANDLTSTERYGAGNHGGGIQTEGKDIGARRRQADNNWQRYSGSDKTLTNWVVYRKPFYAMESGTVIACWRNAPENVPDSTLQEFKDDKIPNAGNHLWVLQDDGVYALYAHAVPGTIPSRLCPHDAKLLTNTARVGGNPARRVEAVVKDGARVNRGEQLGLIGNSGQSSGPHLHVHMEKDGKPVAMRFERGMTTSFVEEKASLDGPWARFAGKAMTDERSLIWAPHALGNYTFNGVPGANYQRMVDHLADSGLMPVLITCKSNGATLDSTWEPAKGQWASFHGMTAQEAAAKHAHYTGLGYKRTSSYTCGSASVAVWRK